MIVTEKSGQPMVANGMGAAQVPPSIAGDAQSTIQRQDHEIESLCREILERYEEATFVYRLSEQIGSVLGERAIAELVLRHLMDVLAACEGEIWLRRGSATEVVVSSSGRSAGPPSAVVRDILDGRRSGHSSDASGAEGWIVVALGAESDAPIGAIALYGRRGDKAYRTGEMKLLRAVSSLATAFLRIDRHAESARIADRRRREDEIARIVHGGLLPKADPLFAGLEIAGGCRAADNVGGDYYGYVALVDGSLGVAIADVSGHGVGAAMFMATAKGALQSEAREGVSPADVLARVNDVLAADFTAAEMFATFVFARFLPDGRRIVWANAGHNPPIVLRSTGEVQMLAPSGPPMGIVSHARWTDAETVLAPGDTLLLYTDGVTEARSVDRQPFGIERLIAAAREPLLSAPLLRRFVLEALDRHTQGEPTCDDQTLVVVRGVMIPEEA